MVSAGLLTPAWQDLAGSRLNAGSDGAVISDGGGACSIPCPLPRPTANRTTFP